MEKINKSFSRQYSTSKIFLDDLIEIEKVLVEYTEDVTIKNDDYQFLNIRELENKYKNKVISKLKISTRNPYIVIEFRKMEVSLYCSESDVRSYGIFSTLDSIISKTSRKPEFMYSYSFYLVSNIILIFLVKSKSAWSVALATIIALWTIHISYINLFRNPQIILSEKNNLNSFLSRNKDQIIVTIISVILSVGCTSLVYYLWGIK